LWVLQPPLEIANGTLAEVRVFGQPRLRQAARAAVPLKGLREYRRAVHRILPSWCHRTSALRGQARAWNVANCVGTGVVGVWRPDAMVETLFGHIRVQRRTPMRPTTTLHSTEESSTHQSVMQGQGQYDEYAEPQRRTG
jgi:hypothetical protein